jgi:hypothetical protein
MGWTADLARENEDGNFPKYFVVTVQLQSVVYFELSVSK